MAASLDFAASLGGCVAIVVGFASVVMGFASVVVGFAIAVMGFAAACATTSFKLGKFGGSCRVSNGINSPGLMPFESFGGVGGFTSELLLADPEDAERLELWSLLLPLLLAVQLSEVKPEVFLADGLAAGWADAAVEGCGAAAFAPTTVPLGFLVRALDCFLAGCVDAGSALEGISSR